MTELTQCLEGMPAAFVEALNFHLIVESGGRLTSADFDRARLELAWKEKPSMALSDLEAAALKLVLEFQAKIVDTELEVSPIGESAKWPVEAKEISHGNVPIPVSGVQEQV